MKIYVAAPYSMREDAQKTMKQLEDLGYEVTSTWLKIVDNEDCETAEMDLADIERAHALVLLNPPEYANKGNGGRHVEFGYALACGKRLIVIGVKTNVFHQLDNVSFYESFSEVPWNDYARACVA